MLGYSKVSDKFLTEIKSKLNNNNTIPFWIELCEDLHAHNIDTFILKAITTTTKYVKINVGNKKLRIRISDHPKKKEKADKSFFFNIRLPLNPEKSKNKIVDIRNKILSEIKKSKKEII